MQKYRILFGLNLTMLLLTGPWITTIAQNVSVPIGLLRDYNSTKEQLKVARDSVIILASERAVLSDSVQFYKQAYLKESKRKKGWRTAALVLAVKEVIRIAIRSMGGYADF